MSVIEKIKSKVTCIDIDELIIRLKIELNLMEITEHSKAMKLLEYAIYSSLLLILDIGNLKEINDELYSTWVDMIKDYWVLNRYDKLIKSDKYDMYEDDESDDIDVSSIKIGDTQVNFSNKSNTVELNGTTYTTGTINFDENILREKYKKAIYKHRKLRWG